jgi:feruloyl esterase
MWTDEDGETVIERYDITGMAHGTPLMPGTGEGESGQAGAHMLDARISSTDRIAAFFAIAPEPAQRRRRASSTTKPEPQVAAWMQPPSAPKGSINVQQVIDDALRAAGIKR